MAVLSVTVAGAMASLVSLPRKLLNGIRIKLDCTNDVSLEKGLPIDMGAEGLRYRATAGQLASSCSEDGSSPTTTSGTLTPGSTETSIETQQSDDVKNSFLQTTLRHLSTDFSSTASSQEAVEAKELLDKSRGYDHFKKNQYEKAPPGFPRLSKYISTDGNYEVWRGFRNGHVRHLLRYQAEITELEKALEQLDEDDDANPDMRYRLKHTRHKPHWDTKRRELEEEHRTKLMQFDEVMLKHAQVQALPRPSSRNHRSVFNWIWTNKPLAKGYDDFIFFANDMVTTKVCGPNYFEDFIKEHVHTWPISILEKYLTGDSNVVYYSQEQLETYAGHFLIGITIVSLLAPVFLLFLVPMARVLMCLTASIFIVAFAWLLLVVTKGDVYRVCVGTATYCAVLFVFLGNISVEAGKAH
ncbi:hypothetical protein DL98DRAFT_515661 [Cadophora sp. DSE1049]|nr:hypothetical protein DL98DRAFT_515661 [Cadophora sp. DSE1049]